MLVVPAVSPFLSISPRVTHATQVIANNLSGFGAPLYPPSPLERFNRVSTQPSTSANGIATPGLSFSFPAGWVVLKEPPVQYGVLFSSINPDEPGETVAVYAAPLATSGPVSSAAALGASLASVAANGELASAQDVTVDGRRYARVAVLVGGGTAGRFGAAVELRSATIYGDQVYFLRATATRSRWLDPALDIQRQLNEAIVSFRLRV